MEFALTQDFPAGMDLLWSTLGKRDYVRRKYSALGATLLRVRHFSATARAIDIELERDMPVDATLLPAWSRSLVGPTLTLRQRSAWRRDGPRHATATIAIAPRGLPLRAQGRAMIDEIGPHLTRMRMDWHVGSAVPILGERTERLLARQIQAALDADHAFTVQYLGADTPARLRS
jgi:hypothetical protein